MRMEASATVNKRARVTRLLRGVWRHALIDLFLVEIVVAVFLVMRLPIPVRPVRLDAADVSALTVRVNAGTWPAQSLTLDTPEEIADYCALFNGLRAPKERHPQRYRILGGATYEFAFTREDGAALTVGVTSGTPLLSVKEAPSDTLRYYHVEEETVSSLCEEAAAVLDPVGGAG